MHIGTLTLGLIAVDTQYLLQNVSFLNVSDVLSCTSRLSVFSTSFSIHHYHHHRQRNSHYSVAKLSYNHVKDISFYALEV